MLQLFFMKYYLYHFEHVTPEEKEILVAVLTDLSFNGFEELNLDLLAYATEEVHQQMNEQVIAELGIDYFVKPIEMVNWNEQWEKSFQPVEVFKNGQENPEVYIHASFHQPSEKAKYNISITPKMSFGTGHHETTMLMMEALSAMEVKGKNVVDFGTGTAVLAIYASLLGAHEVLAIDYDEWCIQNAQENISENKTENIQLMQADFYGNHPADIILANINLNIILANLEAMLQSLNPQGTLLLSGMLLQDEPQILAQLNVVTNAKITVTHKGNWIAVQLDMK